MIEVLAAGQQAQDFMNSRGWDFAFIGGLAVNRWGRARNTNDADICLFSGFGSEERFVDALIDRFATRIDDARQFALENRVILLAAENGFGLDISLGAFDYERRAIDRGSMFQFPDGAKLRTVSAEDLVVLKAFAGRAQDWFDIEGVLTRQVQSIRMALVREELAPLCELKGAPETLERLEQAWSQANQD